MSCLAEALGNAGPPIHVTMPDGKSSESKVKTPSLAGASFKFSVVIPVYNSEGIVGQTVDRTVAFFTKMGWRHEIVLVNDGSTDRSWEVMAEKAAGNGNVRAINLLRNYGQHTALFCGLRHSTGDCVITIDDDLQNPPEEIVHLVAKADEGYDVVFGRFRQKQHSFYRRFGSRLIAWLNRRIFGQPKDLEVTNFRYLRRDVVDRILTYRTNFPYLNGLAVRLSSKRANVLVDHRPRKVGKSTYGLVQIYSLVTRILYNYSAFPLQVISMIGFVVAILSFFAGSWFLIKAMLFGASVAGWASIVVLVSFLGGVNIAIVSMLGEYLIRLVRQSSENSGYHIASIINPHE